MTNICHHRCHVTILSSRCGGQPSIMGNAVFELAAEASQLGQDVRQAFATIQEALETYGYAIRPFQLLILPLAGT